MFVILKCQRYLIWISCLISFPSIGVIDEISIDMKCSPYYSERIKILPLFHFKNGWIFFFGFLFDRIYIWSVPYWRYIELFTFHTGSVKAYSTITQSKVKNIINKKHTKSNYFHKNTQWMKFIYRNTLFILLILYLPTKESFVLFFN